MKRGMVVPAESGKKGLPPGVGSSAKPKSGMIVPSESGTRGKPHNKGFPGTKPARD